MDRVERRGLALQLATSLIVAHGGNHHGLTEATLYVATEFDAWLAAPPPTASAEIVAGTPTPRTEPLVSLVMPDNDKVTLSIAALDVEQVVVPGVDFTDPAGPYLAPFTWAADNTTLANLTPAADTLSVDLESNVGQAGTVTVTATDANGKALPPFTVEIDPSAVTTAGIVAGTPVPRTDTPAA